MMTGNVQNEDIGGGRTAYDFLHTLINIVINMYVNNYLLAFSALYMLLTISTGCTFFLC